MLNKWAKDWNIPAEALNDLMGRTGALLAAVEGSEAGASESRVQSRVRLAISNRGDFVTRNNVGALRDERGVPVRYGLMNESKDINKVIKSGDLIGGRRVLITPEMVGSVILQFYSVECKEAAWQHNPKDPHEQAQLNWCNYINSRGGYAIITNTPDFL